MIDKIDQKILDILQQDASLSTHRISKKTLIPQTTVLNRITKLKKTGVIKRCVVEIDFKKLDKKIKALIFVKINKEIEKKKTGNIGNIEMIMCKHPFVLNIKRLMGKWDFVIELVCKDIDELNEFLIRDVRAIDLVADTETVVVLNEWP